tara:strand:- start:12250 stop:15039 length:2790 start_codon:yes stop_codon:yes gene_type:complete
LSQVKTLPITATRWLSLLLCAITAATITVFLSKVGFVQKAYSSLGAILNANPVLHYSSALLAGIGIKLLLDKFYISHPKRSIGFNWRYPPVTIAVLVSLLLTALYVINTVSKLDEATLYARSFMSLKYLALTFIAMLITVIYQIKLYTKKPIFTAVLVALSATFIIFAVNLADTTPAFNVFMYLAASYFILAAYLLFDEYRQSKQPSIITEKEDVTIQVNPELNSLKDFQKWFADDRPIVHKSDLEPDLQVYADRIYNRLLKGGDEYQQQPLAQHIALCGSFGCGKSSIVNAIANDLKTLPEKDVVWIHSDISTWGAESGSVAHVLLGHIIDDISQYIDMCAFRALPKHYTEALKSGGSVFQFASTLLTGPVDSDTRFQMLNDVLETTCNKVLITLQDVDRGTGNENEKRLNDIAALLDRLKGKGLNNINFIIAMGNSKKEEVEVLSKIADHIENIAVLDHTKLICKWAELNTKKVFDNQMKLLVNPSHVCFESFLKSEPLSFNSITYKPAQISSNLIGSIRILKRVMRRVDSCWTKDRLLGEVSFDSLLLLMVLREFSPYTFNTLISEYKKLDSISLLDKVFEPPLPPEALFKRIIKKVELIPEQFSLELLLKFLLGIDNSNSTASYREQGLNYKIKGINYLERVLLENVPETELRDQVVFKNYFEPSPSSMDSLIHKILAHENWAISFGRFGKCFCLGSSQEEVSRRKNFALGILSAQGEKNTELLLKSEAFENLLVKVAEDGGLEDILTKLVLLNSSEHLLDTIIIKYHELLKRQLSMLGYSPSSSEVIKTAEIFDFLEQYKSHTEKINIIEFLEIHFQHLCIESIRILIEYITIQKLICLEQNYLNEYSKSYIEIICKVRSHKAYKLLAEFTLDSSAKSDSVKEHIKTLSLEEKDGIKAGIKNLPEFELGRVHKNQTLISMGLNY